MRVETAPQPLSIAPVSSLSSFSPLYTYALLLPLKASENFSPHLLLNRPSHLPKLREKAVKSKALKALPLRLFKASSSCWAL
jgi:hypothetical protein